MLLAKESRLELFGTISWDVVEELQAGTLWPHGRRSRSRGAEAEEEDFLPTVLDLPTVSFILQLDC
eukprot:14220035-Heterocapsa_arctica.AAC.1